MSIRFFFKLWTDAQRFETHTLSVVISLDR